VLHVITGTKIERIDEHFDLRFNAREELGIKELK
jgi:hypothetical protein